MASAQAAVVGRGGSARATSLPLSHLLNSAENVTKIDKLWPKETGVFRKGVLETEEQARFNLLADCDWSRIWPV